MVVFQWVPSFETGLSEVDDHHRHLVTLVNGLADELMKIDGPERSAVVGIYQELADYAVYHFAAEERLMTVAGIDRRHADQHVAEHMQFLSDFTRIHTTLGEGDPKAAQELMDFLTSWLTYHILGTDKAMARQVAGIKAGLSAAAAFEAEEQPAEDGTTKHLLRSMKRLYEVVTTRNHQLMELNRALEAKVAERTRALEATNESLARVTDDLKSSEARMTRAIDILQAGICEVDLTTGASYRSPRHDQIFGYESLLPEWTFDIFWSHVIPEDRALVEARLRPALENHQSWDFECHILRSDQEVRWIRAFGHHYFDAQGIAIRRVGVFVDVTERRRLRDALEESRERLSLATRFNGIGMWDWNLVTQSLEWDDTLFELYGRRREEFPGSYEAWPVCVHPDDIKQSEALLQKSIKEDLPFDCDFRVVLPGGGIRHINSKAVVLRSNDGRALRMLGTNMDITDRKVTEAQRETLIQELQNALAEVKALSGLLPICSNCKKIRDDQGYWNRIEAYISEHSEATFTHGVCPDCADVLFPGHGKRRKTE